MVWIEAGRQARCDDRRRTVAAAGELEKAFQDSGARSDDLSFHYFVNYALPEPRCEGPLWMRWTLHDVPHLVVEDISEDEVLGALQRSGELSALSRLDGLTKSLGTYARGVVLPEVDPAGISNETPVWSVRVVAGDATVQRKTVAELRDAMLRVNPAGAQLGAKGLTYGMSAVECWLSQTATIFPGDCDLLMHVSESMRAIVEFKRHNINEPISAHFAARYYPRPDGRKYDGLFLLRDRLEDDLAERVSVVIVYFAPGQRKARWQVIERGNARLEVAAESDEVAYSAAEGLDLRYKVLKDLTRALR